ncbi:MAG TPA: amidohydrolase family protein [Candidatus Limnocylindria bacterium]|nr:amidohydrolase family protein [Candidatus Limnocylindria bacterium]
MDPIARANGLLEQYARRTLDELPRDTPIFDAHIHLGTDIDGMVGDRDELLGIQRAYGVGRSFVFCLDEPDRHPSFSAANDRTLAHARAAPDELLPFVRLDLDERPIEEATRCLGLGACGIKLHPRAQRFLPDDPRLEPVFALAAARRVPILIHGGRGLPPIADSLGRLLDRHAPPALIVAHAGIVDLAAMARNFAGRPGVFFDTSVWSPLDLLDLYRLVPPEQVVYASDYPYGRQPNSLLMAVRTARASGFDDRQLRALLHDTAAGIADGAEPVRPSAPQGAAELSHPVTFLRIHQYLTMASAMLWMRHPADTYGVIGLALNACDERSNGYRAQTEQIRELLVVTRDLWELASQAEDETGRRRAQRGAFRLVHLATVLAVTNAG